MSARDEEIHELVRQESADCLQRIETNLLALESGKGGTGEIDAILRDAHSIKGSSAMVGWRELATLASAIEDRVEQARALGAFPIEFADPLLRAADALSRGLRGESGVTAPLVAELAALAPPLDGEPAQPPIEEPTASVRAEEQPHDEQADEGPQAERQAGAGPKAGAAPTIRIPAGKVDRMLDVVG
jgi:chemotaxis protein histidine kinase CheA